MQIDINFHTSLRQEWENNDVNEFCQKEFFEFFRNMHKDNKGDVVKKQKP